MTTRQMSIVEGLRDAIRVAMRSDPTVFVLGEDIGIAGGFGGGFTVTLGLSDEFGHDESWTRLSPKSPSSAQRSARP